MISLSLRMGLNRQRTHSGVKWSLLGIEQIVSGLCWYLVSHMHQIGLIKSALLFLE